MPRIGIIGGSGIYDMNIIENEKEVTVETPYGLPSDAITVGEIEGVEVAFLPRHGRGHFIPPHKIPNCANIFALKQLGVEYLITISAVGSLREDLAPGHFVIGEQLIDRCVSRTNTFFEEGVVAHVSLADPFCPVLSQLIYQAVEEAKIPVHRGTYLCMQGPQFSTRAESKLYRSWGLDVIGMTMAPEAKLAREAQMCLGSIFTVTDYDCWREDEEGVNVTDVVETLAKNTENIKEVLKILIPCIEYERACSCPHALDSAVITSAERLEENLDPHIREILLG